MNETTLRELQASPSAFRSALRIETDEYGPMSFEEVLDPWQRRDFEALDGGWLRVAGHQSDGPVKLRGWIERPRGHSKTADLAAMVCWVLFASHRRLSGYAAAADKDQSRLLRDGIEKLLRLNRWLAATIKADQNKISNPRTGSTLEILSSDAPSSYGLTPDFIIADEVTHWRNRDLWDSLLSSAAKRQHCMVVVIGNAGFGATWQFETREAIRTDPTWHFSRLNGPIASWITAEQLAEQRRLLPLIAYQRLWENRWTTGSGDALSDADITAALTLNGPTFAAERGWSYYCGLDLGLTRDRAAAVVVGRHVGFMEETAKPVKLSHRQEALIDAGLAMPPDDVYDRTIVDGSGRLKVCRVYVADPAESADGKVDIEAVEKTILLLHRSFPGLKIGADPWQAAYLIERLRKQNVVINPLDFVPQNLKSMCSATLEAFSDRKIDLFDDDRLLTDLHNLRVVEKQYGVRLDSPRGPNGHGDAATALSIALHLCSSTRSLFIPPVNQGTLIVA